MVGYSETILPQAMTKRRSKQFTEREVCAIRVPTACLRQPRVEIPLDERENGEAEDMKFGLAAHSYAMKLTQLLC
jgi:hypothetical protein